MASILILNIKFTMAMHYDIMANKLLKLT